VGKDRCLFGCQFEGKVDSEERVVCLAVCSGGESEEVLDPCL